ncbi:unnamed protein product [Linum tenue]|uniref:Uncharacterized protein n=1 Tax=Linum tenue TaxID=586396 RepID=A0AAV0IS44_9ROSI|nr:unnamed protein product [Linum tenue]
MGQIVHYLQSLHQAMGRAPFST